MMLLSTIVSIAIGLLFLYAVLWIYIYIGHWRIAMNATNAFLTALNNQTYEYDERSDWGESENIICFIFQDGQRKRFVDVTASGEIKSGVKWAGESDQTEVPLLWKDTKLGIAVLEQLTMIKLGTGVNNGEEKGN